MTVTLSKRLFEESASSSACLASPPASKKLRALTPLADHLPTSSHGKPGVPGLGSLQQHHHSSARKRRHDTAAEGSNGAASPPTGLKRGKRGDGRPSTAAASPNTAKSALEALLTYEGLEKDHDLAAEVAYITARQNAARTAGDSDAAAGPSTGGPSSSSAQQDRSSPAGATAAGASSSAARVQDAARSSREKRRDQDQNPRARRASAGGRSSRDQVASPIAPQPAAADDDASAAVAEAAAAADPDSPRAVTLDLTADKEWQRLFAVLTISDAASGRRSNSGNSAGGAPGITADGVMGTATHRLTDAMDGAAPSTPSAAAAATAAAAAGSAMQEAPSTPARLEGGANSTTAAAGLPGCSADATPRRSSFLAGEFSRVQQLHNTPPRPPAARSVRLHTFCAPTHTLPDCDMAM